MDEVRIGILGGGGILGAHAPGFQAMAGKCKVVAAAEPDTERHARVRSLVGDGVVFYKDYQDLLDKADVDAVDILLPHDLHMPAAIAAARAGKPVLVEKVMARNVWECDRMIEACEKAGVSLTVCHDRRYDGAWMALKSVVDSGALGEIFYWKLEHNQWVLFAGTHWARERDRLGGGAIMSCLTHQIDALRYYGGEVESVTCMTRVLPDQMEDEAVGIVAARMKSGAIANMSINWRTRSHAAKDGLWYELTQACGIDGEAYYMSGKGTYVLVHKSKGGKMPFEYESEAEESGPAGFKKVKSGEWRGHVGCIREWIKSLRGEEARILTSGRDVRGTVEVAEAAYISEKEGRTVALPVEPKPWVSNKDRERGE